MNHQALSDFHIIPNLSRFLYLVFSCKPLSPPSLRGSLNTKTITGLVEPMKELFEAPLGLLKAATINMLSLIACRSSHGIPLELAKSRARATKSTLHFQ